MTPRGKQAFPTPRGASKSPMIASGAFPTWRLA